MGVVPQTITGRIEFFENHLPVWAAAPTAIGLTAVQIADLNTLVSQARAALEAAQQARDNAKSATLDQNLLVEAMYDFGSDLIKTIKAYAETINDPTVYSKANVPPPAPPSPAGPPEQPTALTATLQPNGSLRLSWKGTLAQKAFFSIFRRSEGEANFTMLDSVNARDYTDSSIPAGSNSVTYIVQARRDDYRVDSGYFQVNFGTSAGTTTVTTSTIGLAA